MNKPVAYLSCLLYTLSLMYEEWANSGDQEAAELSFEAITRIGSKIERICLAEYIDNATIVERPRFAEFTIPQDKLTFLRQITQASDYRLLVPAEANEAIETLIFYLVRRERLLTQTEQLDAIRVLFGGNHASN